MRVPIEYVLARYFLSRHPVTEEVLMDAVKVQYERLLGVFLVEPAINLDERGHIYPEVVTVLRRWVNSGVLGLPEPCAEMKFTAANPDYLRAVVARIDADNPRLPELFSDLSFEGV